jgi:cell division protein FtsA
MVKQMIRPPSGLVAALDIGSSKMACVIARIGGDRKPRLLGFGHRLSAGVRKGAIVDMEAAASAISAVVQEAETMADERISSVFVTMAGGDVRSDIRSAEITIGGRAIVDQDVQRSLTQAHAEIPLIRRRALHMIPLGYSVDSTRAVEQPRGLFANKMSVSLHVASAEEGPIRSVEAAAARAHLEVDTLVAPSYAAGLSVLTPDEAELGSTVVDIGGGTASISVFQAGMPIFIDSLSIGGHNVTQDIALVLKTPLADAERLKAIDGNCIPTADDEHRLISAPLIGEDNPAGAHSASRADLVRVINLRMEEMFEMVQQRIKDAGLARASGGSLVITGGGANLNGAAELAGRVMGKRARIGRPSGIMGLDERLTDPQFASAIGLIRYAAKDAASTDIVLLSQVSSTYSVFGRLGAWFKEHF